MSHSYHHHHYGFVRVALFVYTHKRKLKRQWVWWLEHVPLAIGVCIDVSGDVDSPNGVTGTNEEVSQPLGHTRGRVAFSLLYVVLQAVQIQSEEDTSIWSGTHDPVRGSNTSKPHF